MARRRRAALALVGAILLGLVALTPAAVAQSERTDEGALALREVDARDPAAVTATFSWSGDPAAVEGLTLTEEGEEVEHEPAAPITPPQDVVLLVDTSEAMNGTPLVEAKAALTEWVAQRPEGSRAALVTYADEPTVAVNLTNDDDALLAGIDAMAASGLPGLWRAVEDAGDMLAEEEGSQHQLVLVAGGPDAGSTVTPGAARGAVLDADAAVYAVATASADPAGLQALVAAAGGTFEQAPADELTPALTDVATSMRQQYEVTFASDTDLNVVDLSLTVGDATVDASYAAGGVLEGGSRLAPKPPAEPDGFAPLQGNGGKLLAVLATLLAVSLGVYALVMALTKDPSGLQSVLQPYGDGYVEQPDDDGREALATSAILQRAVDLTEQIAERQGTLAKAEAALERANLPLRAAEALFFYGAFVVVVLFLALVLSQNIIVSLIAAVLAALVPAATVSFLSNRRRKQFTAQLPDALALLSGTLRAGYSLMQGVEAVAQEVDEPMGQELRRVVTEARLGRPLEEALDATAERLDIADFSWAVMAIRIQREVGGNLAELLLTVGETMTARERLRREINALTAEGKMSAIVLGILPPALGGVMFVVNPDYIEVLFSTTIGNIMLGVAVLLAGFGFWWMKKIIEIDI